MVVLFVVGVVLILELIAALIDAGKSAPGLTWMICRPFRIPLPMIVGFIVRLALIGVAVYCLTKSIPAIF